MNLRRLALIAIPFLWLLTLFLIPFLIALKISLSEIALAIPPYTPTLDIWGGWGAIRSFVSQLSFDNFIYLTTDDLYWKSYVSSLKIAFFATILTLVAGYPIAYAMSRARDEWRPALLMLVILPFWSSFLIRIYAWIGIISKEGLINQLLTWLGVIDQPLQMMNTDFAIYLGILYGYLPFMVLPIYAALDKMDVSLLEAAEDLGCSRLSAFWLVTVPQSKQGIIAGCFLVFIPAIGEFVIPSLLGGSHTLMIGSVLWDEFFSNRDWPTASAVAVVLLIILIVPILLFQRSQTRAEEDGQ
ncbi:ABC transporter permease subunit [Martelella sp. HB161492]|uniref:ABC transporter permease subunit n=1 Tax=Martelella sp. HB161492 TaxID=2720726 RepID=UPI00158FFC3F|nr:ABC transporter permease subunit [Martelella sp. HB161492]